MLQPKRIPVDGIPAALERARHYRLLNEPMQAESICLDILEVDPEHQLALVTLLLALTDQFPTKFTHCFERAKDVLERLKSQYDQHYYAGIVNERWGTAQIDRHMPTEFAVSWLREAMKCYEKAGEVAEAKNPDPTLRWNTCARLLAEYTQAEPTSSQHQRDVATEYGDDVPLR